MCEYEEAVEAIDTAIELKNEKICGRKSVDTDESLQWEQGEQMLFKRLSGLSLEETRTMLYKYVMKAIDLKSSSKTLELQLHEMDRQRETWEWREKMLRSAIQQARVEGEKNLALLQRQYELKINLMLKHFANSENSSSYNTLTTEDGAPCGGQLDFYSPPQRRHHHYLDSSSTDSLDLLRALQGKPEVAALAGYSKYKPLEKRRGDQEVKERESKNRFQISKFLARYQFSEKKKYAAAAQQSVIPLQNLKQLNSNVGATLPGATKVTRQKNKLIIQHTDN